MRLGYKNLVVECAEEDCVMLSLDAGYDFVKGVTKRLYIDLLRGKRLIADVCHWGLAEIAALMWLFFRDVDFVKIEGKRYFILTRGPRRRITVEEFERSVPSKLRIN
ncbi:hypothetical protein DRJ17_06670 [Candidatus Woesearchaeota archaeon]|nr:MAG: hypothetical protein DRJ17_06670 [Candidatus Woesearchaeota archaeon]